MIIKCKSGLSLSVVCGPGTYSGGGSVEVGYPSEPEPLLEPYREHLGDNDPTQCVYPYVPLEVLEKVYLKHTPIPHGRFEIVACKFRKHRNYRLPQKLLDQIRGYKKYRNS